MIESKMGWHLVEVTGRKEQELIPFEEARDEIYQSFRSKAVTEAIDKLKRQPGSRLGDAAS